MTVGEAGGEGGEGGGGGCYFYLRFEPPQNILQSEQEYSFHSLY